MRRRNGVTKTSFCDLDATASAAPLHPRAASAAQRLRSYGASVHYSLRFCFGVQPIRRKVVEVSPTIRTQFCQPIPEEDFIENSQDCSWRGFRRRYGNLQANTRITDLH